MGGLSCVQRLLELLVVNRGEERKCVDCGDGGGPSDDNARGGGRTATPAVSAAAELVFRVAAGVSVRGGSALREVYE